MSTFGSKKEFHEAKRILSGIDGELFLVNYDYECFRFKNKEVCIIFYPHKTSAGNYHIRVRDGGSSNKKLAGDIMNKLYRETGYNCTFSRKMKI